MKHFAYSFLLSFVTSSVFSQEFSSVKDFFIHSLHHEKLSLVGNNEDVIHSEEITKYKQLVWEAWRQANVLYSEEKIPQIQSLQQRDTFYWHLPSTLEPNAVMPFYYGTKGDKPSTGWPFFLYLHGSGPKEHEFNAGFSLCNYFDDAPSLYFIPQIPQEGSYYRWWQQSKQWAWEKLFRQILANPEVDANKIYLFGISEGGYGSQRLASFYADYLAAAGPMAGGEITENAPAENCGHIGFSFMTGEKDYMFARNRLTTRAKELFDSLQNVHPDEYVHSIELIPNRGHGIDYASTTPWLKSFTRTPRPSHFVWEDFPMDARYRKGFYNIQVIERDTLDNNERTRYEMRISNNVVELNVKRVVYETIEKEPIWGIPIYQTPHYSPITCGKIVLYLDNTLIDPNHKVSIIVNGKRVRHTRVIPKMEHLVNSCACFGDPERIFPYGITIQLP